MDVLTIKDLERESEACRERQRFAENDCRTKLAHSLSAQRFEQLKKEADHERLASL